MKKLLLFAMFVTPLAAISQQRIEKDTLYLANGAKLAKGEDLYFGSGSNMADRSFNYIYTSPASVLVSPTKLPSGWASMKMKIHDFKKLGTKKAGDKFYVILSGGNLVKYWAEIDQAIATKEVIIKGVNDVEGTSAASKPLSTADELKKFKDLLDSGAITKEEYEIQKKKLLGL